ncbi:MAG TPA: alpha/beta fold hydrolase, partial [Polyangiaceae bacterium]|nr:alpha/beta fold hydrolase [Polyangiaceae bacterium]
LRVERELSSGAALAACLAYGAPWPTLSDQLRHFCDDFSLETQPLFRLPFFETEINGERLRFIHARSAERRAPPLLLLHGYSAALAEFQSLVEPLSRSFHVICPSLPGFGFSDGAPCPRAAAAACGALMQRLGYERYLVHGSDLGATIALELGAQRAAEVAGLHVTSVAAYPAADEGLTSHEKSQLARLTELRDELRFHLPESPSEELAFALSRLDDEASSAHQQLLNTLWTGLTLTCAWGDAPARRELYRYSLRTAPSCKAPLSLHAFPLAAPSLRRFAERRQHVVKWQEHPHGGCMPALEQPDTLLDTLRSFGQSSAS